MVRLSSIPGLNRCCIADRDISKRRCNSDHSVPPSCPRPGWEPVFCSGIAPSFSIGGLLPTKACDLCPTRRTCGTWAATACCSSLTTLKSHDLSQSASRKAFGFLEISLSQGKTPQSKVAERKTGIDVHSSPERTDGFFWQILFL